MRHQKNNIKDPVEPAKKNNKGTKDKHYFYVVKGPNDCGDCDEVTGEDDLIPGHDFLKRMDVTP